MVTLIYSLEEQLSVLMSHKILLVKPLTISLSMALSNSLAAVSGIKELPENGRSLFFSAMVVSRPMNGNTGHRTNLLRIYPEK